MDVSVDQVQQLVLLILRLLDLDILMDLMMVLCLGYHELYKLMVLVLAVKFGRLEDRIVLLIPIGHIL